MGNKFVGPFFYINNQVVALKVEVEKGEKIGDFINHPKSHMEFFNEINPLDDYGHYPRGRVIYDTKTKRFYIYIDRCLNNAKIKEEILKTFNLEKGECVFKRDSHYTHDYL